MATSADFLLQRLGEWGVRRVFGYPGDGINGIMGAFERAKPPMEFVQVRHEEMAAFMACAHAKYTGQVGVCVATSGPGAIHLLNGLYDAKADHQPVVAIVGQANLASLGGDYQQEVDLLSLFKDVAHQFDIMAASPLQVRHLVDRAMRIARSERGVCCLIIPKDVQEMPAVEVPPHKHGTVHSSSAYAPPRVFPRDHELRAAADILNAGKKVAILVGAGAKDAGDVVIELAHRLKAGVAKALLGKAVVPDDLPFVTGTIGLLGTRPTADMMNECDTLLLIGTSFPYAEFLPKEGQALGVQIDIDGRMAGLRYPTDFNLIGDSKETLARLLPLLDLKTEVRWQNRIERNVSDWWDLIAARAKVAADPMNPELVFHELSPRLPDGCIISGDAGTSTSWMARHLKMRRGMQLSLSGSLASMGSAVPYAIAAKFAHPGRPCIALAGDGAMQMNGINELITVARYWRRWSDPRIVFLVLNNRELSMVSWEMRVAGEPKFAESQDLPDFPYAEYARSLGFDSLKVDDPARIGDAWDRAFASDRPFLLEAVTDPNVPTLPPHISLDQARGFTQALLKGDPNQGGIIKQSVKAMIASILPNKNGDETKP